MLTIPRRVDFARYHQQERVELEVGLVREGLRAVVFLAFCACFFTSIFLIAKPELRNSAQAPPSLLPGGSFFGCLPVGKDYQRVF